MSLGVERVQSHKRSASVKRRQREKGDDVMDELESGVHFLAFTRRRCGALEEK